ncbi:DUF6714 family protein [Desulfogranum japonicum]|uniref:DUF6714 family protein n=1 Tax=Desulfogranum japonicum TaxID=231447 RepID=UPI00048B7E12|nr:DUF6714 family protein [Desulfogranum japonicum]
MDRERLISEIKNSFSGTSRPEIDNIVKHDCRECDSLRDDFADFVWSNIPPDIIDKNFDNLPLLTGEAYYHYVPAYIIMVIELDDPYSTLTEFLIYSFYFQGEPTKIEDFIYKKSLFTKRQVEAVKSFLKYLSSDPRYRHHHEDVNLALQEWSE